MYQKWPCTVMSDLMKVWSKFYWTGETATPWGEESWVSHQREGRIWRSCWATGGICRKASKGIASESNGRGKSWELWKPSHVQYCWKLSVWLEHHHWIEILFLCCLKLSQSSKRILKLWKVSMATPLWPVCLSHSFVSNVHRRHWQLHLQSEDSFRLLSLLLYLLLLVSDLLLHCSCWHLWCRKLETTDSI